MNDFSARVFVSLVLLLTIFFSYGVGAYFSFPFSMQSCARTVARLKLVH